MVTGTRTALPNMPRSTARRTEEQFGFGLPDLDAAISLQRFAWPVEVRHFINLFKETIDLDGNNFRSVVTKRLGPFNHTA